MRLVLELDLEPELKDPSSLRLGTMIMNMSISSAHDRWSMSNCKLLTKLGTSPLVS